MTLAQLRYFCTAARSHSITKAAQSLYVTQPTISIAIRELEKEFSLTLFTHSDNHLTLTEEGELFYRKASEILDQCEDLHVEFSGLQSAFRRVRIGIPPLLSTVFFPELLDAFHTVHPDIWLELHEYGSIRACDLVQDEVLDIALINMEFPNIDKFYSEIIMTDPLLLTVSRDHPLAGRSTVDLRELDDAPILLYNQDSVQNRIVQARFAALGVSPRIVMQSSQLTTILKFLRQGNCCCFLFGSILPQFPDLVGIPAEPPLETRVGIVWKRGRHISAGMQAVIDYCRNTPVSEYLLTK